MEESHEGWGGIVRGELDKAEREKAAFFAFYSKVSLNYALLSKPASQPGGSAHLRVV